MPGELWLTTLHDNAGCINGIQVDRADPQILITADLIDYAASWPAPCFELRCTGGHDVLGSHWGDTIVINGSNRRLVYQLTALHSDGPVRWYTARWPD